MLSVLWLIIWATGSKAFYDESSWWASDEGIDNVDRAFQHIKNAHDNFTGNIRTFANSYKQTSDADEMTISTAKMRLRLLQIYKYTRGSTGFDKVKGQSLPLTEGAKFCTMGAQTKVDCNYCNCVAGQMYMCTGMICPLKSDLPQTCREGQKRKIDSCNYCYCRNGQEICTKRYCSNNNGQPIVRSMMEECIEWRRKTVDCNRCRCIKGEWYCTKKTCKEDVFEPPKTQAIPKGTCPKGATMKIKCMICKCIRNYWSCSRSECFKNSKDKSKSKKDKKRRKCKDGTSRQVDSCNKCYCRLGQEYCESKNCGDTERNALRAKVRKKDYICDKWEVKYERCKRCECLGRAWVCTDRYCPPLSSEEVQEPQNTTEANLLLQICKHGEKRMMDNCSDCICIEGNWYCQMKSCYNNKAQHQLHAAPQKIVQHIPDISVETISQHIWSFESDSVEFDDEYIITKDVRLPICHDGHSYKLDCKNCYCDEDDWYCEDKICKIKNKKKGLLRMTNKGVLAVPETKCKLGDTFRFGACNYCYCDKNNKRVCSRNKCPYPKPNQTRYQPPKVEKQCKIGDRFRLDECNYCYCDYERNFVCSRNKCSGARVPLRNTVYAECEEGDIHRIDDCNYCRCNSKRKWKCTQNICPSVYDHVLLRTEKKSCIERSLRTIDCNYCVCVQGVEVCTQKPCWHDHPARTFLHFTEPECEAGESIPAPDACNLCICLNSNIMCTEYPCVERKAVTGRSDKCVEGDKYYLPDGCNFCLCQNGQEFCTSRACLVDDLSSDNQKIKCIEGEVTAMSDGCNLCVCNEGKRTCTNKDCSRTGLRSEISDIRSRKQGGNKKDKPKKRCKEGNVYMQEDDDPYCPNVCICDGGDLLCTSRKCEWGHGKAQYNTKSWPLPGPTSPSPTPPAPKRRNPKRLFIKHESCVDYEALPSDDPCNSCICLNGRKVCTIIPCSSTEKDADWTPQIASVDNLSYSSNKGGTGVIMKKKNAFCEPFTFFSPDNNRFCRNCFCLHNGLALCLLNLCKYSKDLQHKAQHLNSRCTPGETGNPTKCVTCTCSDKRKWVCTRKALDVCQERDCDARDEFHMGFFPYCAECKCSIKEWYCSIKAETCPDHSNVTCPLGTFIHNPNQHCSICLCGGYDAGAHNMCFTEAKCVRQVISHQKD